MKMIILFGAGESGGLIMTDYGVCPIPAFDLAIRQTLKSAAAMVTATTATQDERARQKMAAMATSLCNLGVQQLEEVVGPLSADHSLIFQSDDGGFSCGSTGKPPIPLPWPPPSVPSVPDLIAAGVVEPDQIELLQRAQDRGIKLTKVFEKPTEVATTLGVTLSEKSAKLLQTLTPSKLPDIKDEVDREIASFFLKVAEDGRYLKTWFVRPYEVSQALKFDMSETALNRLITRSATRHEVGVSWIWVGIGVGVVAAAVFGKTPSPIEDRSGIEKI